MKINSSITDDVSYIIGIDFDNTLVNYEDVMHRVAVQQGLIHLEQ